MNEKKLFDLLFEIRDNMVARPEFNGFELQFRQSFEDLRKVIDNTVSKKR